MSVSDPVHSQHHADPHAIPIREPPRCADDWSDNGPRRRQLNEIHNKCTAVLSRECSRQTARNMQFKLSIKQQHTLGERLFVELQPAGPATDRPTISTPVFLLPLSRIHMTYGAKIPSCY